MVMELMEVLHVPIGSYCQSQHILTLTTFMSVHIMTPVFLEALRRAMTGPGHHQHVAEAGAKPRPVPTLQITTLSFHQAFSE